MPFQKVRYLNGSDEPAEFRLKLRGDEGAPREFRAEVLGRHEQLQTNDPAIMGLRKVVHDEPRVVVYFETMVLKLPASPEIEAPADEFFKEAIVSAESMGIGSLTLITDKNSVITRQLLP